MALVDLSKPGEKKKLIFARCSGSEQSSSCTGY
jgi:hypothetical protein